MGLGRYGSRPNHRTRGLGYSRAQSKSREEIFEGRGESKANSNDCRKCRQGLIDLTVPVSNLALPTISKPSLGLHWKLYMRAQLSHRYFRLVWSAKGSLRNESI